eukprot:TRINITY_DN4402_c0_g1_i3.p1 TRINITY_DN4402_c0_g1~~TRINITY_DN4402_c0_g1_i3.p1  ORF type:complete len:680 (+),score=114.13 TRINITY_DN4402_c0_g1_i3:103-2040(+)
MSDKDDVQQQKMVQCFNCDFTAPEATYDDSYDDMRLYRWWSMKTNEFKYACTECIDNEEIEWINEIKIEYLEFGQVVLAQADQKKGEEKDDGGWFRATVWKVDDKKRECEIEFHDKNKGISSKTYDDVKQLETFYCDHDYDIYEVPLKHYYDSYADYARRHEIFPEFDFVQSIDDEIDEELNQSLQQSLNDVLLEKKNLEKVGQNNNTGQNNNAENTQISDTDDNFDENKQNTNQNGDEKKEMVDLINPDEFCYVRGVSVLKSGVIDEVYTCYTKWKNYLQELDETRDIRPKSKRRKRSAELQDNPVKRPQLLNQKFFNIPISLSSNQRIPTNFFINKNNQVFIEGFISGLTPRKNYTKLYNEIGNIFAFFVPMFEKCLQKIYEEYLTIYWEELHGYRRSEDQKKRQKLIQEISCLTDRKMQVFVKAVDYEFQTDENFQGEWKVEGLQQENVVAIGVYCCEMSDNFLDFGLEFRRGLNVSEIDSVAEEYYYRSPPFDTNNAEIILGSVPIQKNRCIVFPNNVQYRITEFQQENKMNIQENVKKCRILYFFLADPELEIVSSADVKNQNWQENKIEIAIELQKIAKRVLGQSLPQIAAEKIVLMAKTGFSREEELDHRRTIIQNTKLYNDRVSAIATRSFDDAFDP